MPLDGPLNFSRLRVKTQNLIVDCSLCNCLKKLACRKAQTLPKDHLENYVIILKGCFYFELFFFQKFSVKDYQTETIGILGTAICSSNVLLEIRTLLDARNQRIS